jgi:hypothetical protein
VAVSRRTAAEGMQQQERDIILPQHNHSSDLAVDPSAKSAPSLNNFTLRNTVIVKVRLMLSDNTVSTLSTAALLDPEGCN